MFRTLVPILFLAAAGNALALKLPKPLEVLSSGRTSAFAESVDVTPDGDMQLGMLLQLPPGGVKTEAGTVQSFRINLTVDCETSKWIGWRLRSYQGDMGGGAPVEDSFDEPPMKISWRDIKTVERETVLNGLLNQTSAQVCNELMGQSINLKALVDLQKLNQPAMSIPGVTPNF